MEWCFSTVTAHLCPWVFYYGQRLGIYFGATIPKRFFVSAIERKTFWPRDIELELAFVSWKRAPICVRVHALFEDGKSYILIPPARVDYRRRWLRRWVYLFSERHGVCCIKRLEGSEEHYWVCKPPWKQLKWKGKPRATLGGYCQRIRGIFNSFLFFGAFGVLTFFFFLHG